MTTADGIFSEASAVASVQAVPLSHLSIELGHLHMEDFDLGQERLLEHFHRVAPWVRAATGQVDARRPRVSTCFMVDDYFARFSTPREVVSDLEAAAKANDLEIDYVARESGCAMVGTIDLAAVVRDHIVDEPHKGTTGGRPATSVSGWLTNGERSPSSPAAAMAAPRQWTPARESAAYHHSVFADVELWSEKPEGRLWSGSFLAAVWQLQRLGLLRHLGEPVAEPITSAPADLPLDWREMPPIVRINPLAAPLRAYRTFSVLDSRFLAIEFAVRTILAQVAIDPTVAGQVLDRARGEDLKLPAQTVERISYVFL